MSALVCGSADKFGIRGVAALAKDSEKHRFAGQVLTARQLAGQYGVTNTDGSRPDCWVS